MSTTERVTLVLPTGILTRLDALAFAEHRSRSNAATLLLAEALDRLELPAAELAESPPNRHNS